MSDVVDGTVEGEDPVDVAASASPAAPEEVAPLFSAPGGRTPAARRTGGELVRSQAAAVAATGFAVGAVTAVALTRHRTKKALKQKARGKTGLPGVVASRSFLVDVHLLGPKE